MMKTIIAYLYSKAPVSVSLLRLVMGWIFIREGTGKLFGWFGAAGLEATYSYFKDLGILAPRFNTFLVGYSELFCGIAFIIGFLTRPASFVIGIIMAVAILTAHRQGGFNYPLVLLAACSVLFQMGAGKLSLDYFLTHSLTD